MIRLTLQDIEMIVELVSKGVTVICSTSEGEGFTHTTWTFEKKEEHDAEDEDTAQAV